MAIEEAQYTVIEQDDSFELRQYEPRVVAETFVEGKPGQADKEGFRRLFKYISGDNQQKTAIAMTAPVNQEASSEKIPMTAPVNQEQVGGKWRVTFMMPASHTLETLPKPLDPRVTLKQEQGQRVAVYRYSGTWSRKRYQDKKARLEAILLERGLKPAGNPTFARYDPPFMPWFLRRNEVLIPVQDTGNNTTDGR
jgi:hypothetical protein